jgi:hypothetical protein
MHPTSTAALALSLSLAAPAGRAADPPKPANPAHVRVETVAPRPADVATIDGMMKAFYVVISGPPGAPRQWARDRTLYIADVRFVSMHVGKDGSPVASVMSHQEYVDKTDPVFAKEGFDEREIHRETQRFGNIAHVFSTYESRKAADGPVFARGVNSVELFWDGARWWIANAIWDDERKDNPLPKELLPAR